MTHFNIKLANQIIEINCLHPSSQSFCQEYLTDETAGIQVSIRQEDIDYERQKSYATDRKNGQKPIPYSDRYLETLAIYRKITQQLIHHDILLCHGSVLVVDDTAYLFTAKSGTGKTTHSRLWLKNIPGAHILNGDKPLLLIDQENVYACGTPWQGKENFGENEVVPLKSICILHRGENNQIEEISASQAFSWVFQQVYRFQDPNLVKKTMELIKEMSQQIKYYQLHCNMDDQAAWIAYEGMKND